jgi:hypothetical protein
MKLGKDEPDGERGPYEVLRPSTPKWLWALAIFLTAAVVFALLDALNTPEPGSVVFPYVVK